MLAHCGVGPWMVAVGIITPEQMVTEMAGAPQQMAGAPMQLAAAPL